MAPGGIVAVAMSGLFALRLGELGYSDGGTLIALSFSVVVATIVAHGFSISHVARWLGVTGASRQGILIVGSTHWSLSLADHLRQLGISVMVSDSSWERLSAARQQGIPSFHGEILAEATEYRLDLSQFQVLAATTDNEAYNALRSEEHTSELQSLMRISYAVFGLKKKKTTTDTHY